MINGIKFNGDVPKLNVSPSFITKITSTDRDGAAKSLVSHISVDDSFEGYFLASD